MRVNSVKYTIARGRNGDRIWNVTRRPSQRGDPGKLDMAEWQTWGPDLNSFEDISGGQGFLGRDYGSNTDGRWQLDTLGPQINTVTLSTYDRTHAASIPDTATMVPGSTLIPGPAGGAANTDGFASFGHYGYFTRGTEIAKVNLSTMALARTGLNPNEVTTTILTTRSQSGAFPNETSLGFGEQSPYQVLTIAAASPNSDTWEANDDGETARVLGIAPDRIAVLTGNTVRGNVLSGNVTMRSPNVSTVATIAGDAIRFTGFAMDGNLWVPGTNNGPYLLDSSTATFFPVIEEIDPDDEQCRGMTKWFPMGVVLPLRDGVRYQVGGQGSSWGMERFRYNTSPVQGYPTGHAGSTKWLYQAVRNEQTGNAWLIAWRPREVGDPHPYEFSPHVIATFSGVQSRTLAYVGTINGLRTNHTLIGGHSSNMFWMTIGRTVREIDDTNYRYAAAGTTFLTELRRKGEVIKDIEAVEFESDSCTANRTIIVGISIDSAAAVNLSTVTSDGFQRLLAVSAGAPLSTLQGGHRIKPQIAYATNSSSAAPQVAGPLRVWWRERPETLRVFTFGLEVADGDVHTAEELQDNLEALMENVPVLVNEDIDNDSYYVRIDKVTIREVADQGGGVDSDRGRKRFVEVQATEWAVA